MTDDDHYFDGVFHDMSVGEFYRVEPALEDGEVELTRPSGEHVEVLGADEWRDVREEFYRVPDHVVEDPAGYYGDRSEELWKRSANFEIEMRYAQEMTEVVERDEDDETEYTDPDEEAASFEPMDDPPGGAFHDRLVDATSDAHLAHSMLSDIHVNLDHIADDQGLFPNDVYDDLRQLQRRALALSTWMGNYRDALKREADSTRTDDDN